MNPVVAASGPRALIGRMLVDRVTISRGEWPNVTIVAEDVPAWVRTSAQVTREVSSGGETVAVSGYTVRLPLQQDVKRGDVLEITVSSDPEQQGRWLTVIEPTLGTEQASRVVSCHESTA